MQHQHHNDVHGVTYHEDWAANTCSDAANLQRRRALHGHLRRPPVPSRQGLGSVVVELKTRAVRAGDLSGRRTALGAPLSQDTHAILGAQQSEQGPTVLDFVVHDRGRPICYDDTNIFRADCVRLGVACDITIVSAQDIGDGAWARNEN